MRLFLRMLVFIAFVSMAACTSRFNVDSEIVNTPVHDDTKVFYLNTDDTTGAGAASRTNMLRSYQRPADDADRLVQHGDPVSIVVNKVILPRHLFDTTADDDRDKKTYDIAVILDVAAIEGEDKQSIAVFYQRGVKANSALSFDDLLVYSQDNWDNRIPPYFRVRIFNVATEKNQRTRELLERVESVAGTLSGIAGAPYAEPIISVAARAAQLVLQGDNEMLVDFQFQLYSPAQSAQSGGMPLGLFRKGGVAVVGVPRGMERQYWANKDFWYDFSSEEIFERTGGALNTVDAPFLLATVITTDTVVPNVVKRRSAEIFELLRSDETVRTDFEKVANSLQRLQVSLEALKAREKFATNPTKETFGDFLDAVNGSEVGEEPNQLSQSLYNWLLATARTVIGVRQSNIEGYIDWFNACSDDVFFDAEKRRYLIKADGVSDACAAPSPPAEAPAPADPVVPGQDE